MNIHDGYDIRNYGLMIQDRVRMSAYVEALRRAVRPGCVVLDIGTGTGIFAFLACQFGAARVHAIEPDAAIEVAKASAKGIAGGERIVWWQGFSSDIELPEKVDVIIADLRGLLPMYGQNIAALIDARRRHLKPDGVMIPRRDFVYAVPASDADEYASVTAPWETNAYGIDFGAGRPFVVNSWWRVRAKSIGPENLLSDPACWGEIDYVHTESTRLDGDLHWRIERASVLHGFYAWFDCETGDGIGFSNAPGNAETVYGRVFFPLQRPVDVIPGDRVEARLSAVRVSGNYVFRWNTRVRDTAGHAKADFRQSSFNAQPRKLQSLHRLAADHVPSLNLDGEIARTVLDAMAAVQPLGVIAGEIFARFPQRFADRHAALDRVATLSALYARDDDP